MNDISTGVAVRGFVRGPDSFGGSVGAPSSSPLDRSPPGLLANRSGPTNDHGRSTPVGGDSATASTNAAAVNASASASAMARSSASDLNAPGSPASGRSTSPDAGVRPTRDSARSDSPSGGGGALPAAVSNRGERSTGDGSVILSRNPSTGGQPSGNAGRVDTGGQSAQNNNGVGTPTRGGVHDSTYGNSRAAAGGDAATADRSGSLSGAGNGPGQPGGQPPGGRDVGGAQIPAGQHGAQATDMARGASVLSGQPPLGAASNNASSSLLGGLLSGVGGLVGSLIRTPEPLLAKLGGTISGPAGGLSSTLASFTGGSFAGLPSAGGILTLAHQTTSQLGVLTSGMLPSSTPVPSSSLPDAASTIPSPGHATLGAATRPEALMTPGPGNQPALPGVLAVAGNERAMTAHNALLVASQNASTSVRAGTANLLSMAGANAGANALAAANLPRNVGAAVALGAGQQIAATAAQPLPAGQRLQTATAGPAQGRADAPAVAGNPPGNRPVAGNVAAQSGAATIAPTAMPAAAASTLAALAAAGAISGELGVQSREAQIAIDREREQASPVDRNQVPMHVFAADVGRQARPSKLEKTSILGRLLSVLSGSRGEGAVNAPDKPLSNSRMKSTQTMMWVFATVAFGSVAAGMTVFWNSGALGVLATPSAQALTLFALIGIAAGGALAAWHAVTGVEPSPPLDSDEATPHEPPNTRAIDQNDEV